jgi:mRNA interferase HicA
LLPSTNSAEPEPAAPGDGLQPGDSTLLLIFTQLWYTLEMNAQELRRYLAKRGCTFATHRGASGHITVRRGDKTSQIPIRGQRKDLGKGLVAKILKDLGLK